MHFSDFDMSTALFDGLLAFDDATQHGLRVTMEVRFGPTFPDAPPFLRVVRPRFHQYTAHITIGGSVCTELLTMSGWRTDTAIGPLLISIRDLLVQGGAIPNLDDTRDYEFEEARQAYVRVASQHGWTVPGTVAGAAPAAAAVSAPRPAGDASTDSDDSTFETEDESSDSADGLEVDSGSEEEVEL